ncbi:uncharacterized protein LOC105834287 [Monomorium pharaonis]|uniref:uncharacterized protein LOC105834287 n=1 Tax=Monomorium pharaonis TaxID=307658 RepID=UPI00102E20D6|nr:uncharacterized protein LOC105834287 [Monomorium pharaonis]
MNCIEAKYFSINKILLLAIGLWPYRQTKLIRFRFIVYLSILITAVLFQLTAFLTSKCTSDLIIKILSVALFFVVFITKYISFAFNMEAVKYLLVQLQHVYNKLQDEYENAIMEKYGYIGKRYTVALATIALTYCLGVVIIVAIGTILIAYLQLTCGLFKISSYRIKRAMRINILKNISTKNDKFVFEGIICAVDIHRQAMKLSKLVVSKFEIMLFCLITVGVISLSLNLFRIFQINASDGNSKEYLFPTIFTTICVIYMFMSNYIGQDIIDHNNHVFVTAYSVQWYVAPLNTQRIILFLLQRGAKNFTLDVGGLFVGSLECFATLVKTSVTYFTVMNSVH